jgi:hypothetical protein
MPRRNRVGIRSANAQLGAIAEWVYPAWTHAAMSATQSHRAKTALRLHPFVSVPNRLHICVCGDLHHLFGRLVGMRVLHIGPPWGQSCRNDREFPEC